MHWKDEGFLLSRNNFDENSIIIESFTLNHGKYVGIVYGGSSRKHKRNFQIGNKIMLNWNSKSQNKTGYFNVELIEPIAPLFFDNKKKTICILAAASILKILLPERQVNKKIYTSFNKLLINFKDSDWIKSYLHWELFLIKEFGYEINLFSTAPKILFDKNYSNYSNKEVNEALIYNKNLLLKIFLTPNRLNIPLSRIILEKYFS